MIDRIKLIVLAWRASFCEDCCRELSRFLRRPRTSMLYRMGPGVTGHRHVVALAVEWTMEASINADRRGGGVI